MARDVSTLLLLLLAAASASGAAALKTDGADRILDDDGTPVALRGLSWFGFNNGQTMVNGLWTPSDGLTFDVAAVAYRIRLLGFNAVRLPFSFADLDKPAQGVSSANCVAPTPAEVARSVIDPASANASAAPHRAFPAPAGWWPARAAGTCNGYVPPSGSTLDRFVWFVQFLARAGFYVMVDDHTEDPTPAAQGEVAWVRNRTQLAVAVKHGRPMVSAPRVSVGVGAGRAVWAARWADLVRRISLDRVAAKRLLVDVLNEPDARGWGWDRMAGMYLSAMDAVYAVNRDVLFVVEGCGQGALVGSNWGDGFVTDAARVTPGSGNDPNPFFRALFAKPYLHRVVISPHVYGPSVTNAPAAWSGAALRARLSASFGYLTRAGYTWRGVTKRFPVAIGEFGSTFQDPRDTAGFLPDFAAYLTHGDDQHQAIPNFFYWCWNANSGDTGGLVDGGWHALQWPKLRYLRALGLTPWYGTTPKPAPAPKPAPKPRASPRLPSPRPRPSPPCRCTCAWRP